MNFKAKAIRLVTNYDAFFSCYRHVKIPCYPRRLFANSIINLSTKHSVLTRNNSVGKHAAITSNCNYSSKEDNNGVHNTNSSQNKPSLYQRFKLMYKEYWYVLVPVHVATSAVWLGGFYYLAISGADIGALLEIAGAPESWVGTIRESKAGGIVTAYTMYKIATPARYTVTLGGTTLSINYLKKWGWIKPIPSKEQLKEMYDQHKTVIKDKMNTTKGEIKDEFTKTATEFTQHMKEAKSGFKQSVTDTSREFKEGVREAADEWRHVGKLIKRNVKDMIKPQKEDK